MGCVLSTEGGTARKTGSWKTSITGRGQQVLKTKPGRIDVKFLKQFSEFQEFQKGTKKADSEDVSVAGEEAQSTPEETLEASYVNLRQTLAEELIDRVKKCPPRLFEKLVVDLLVRMGYGGSRKDAGQAVGQSGDDGIDGIIKEDKLGPELFVYISKPSDGKRRLDDQLSKHLPGAWKGRGQERAC